MLELQYRVRVIGATSTCASGKRIVSAKCCLAAAEMKMRVENPCRRAEYFVGIHGEWRSAVSNTLDLRHFCTNLGTSREVFLIQASLA